MVKKWFSNVKFEKKNFYLDHDNVKIFVDCRWSITPFWYLFYRLIIALYVSFSFGVLIANSAKYAIYFTNWNYTLTLLNFITKAIIVFKYYHFLQDDQGVINACKDKLVKFSWFLTNITTAPAILISIVFWTLIAPKEPALGHSDVHSHFLNCVVVLLDLFMISVPCNFSHVYQPVIYGIIYFAFTAIYWFFGGVNNKGNRAIYAYSDWSKPENVFKMFVFFEIGLVVIYLVIYLLVKLRDVIWDYTNRNKKCVNDNIV